MKEEHIDIDKMVMSAHYLHALEIEDSRREDSMSDMERDDYLSVIKSQGELVDQLKAMLKTLTDTLESMKASALRKDAQIAELTAKINELTSALADAMERINYLTGQLFGETTQSDRYKNRDGKSVSRQEEELDYDGSDRGMDVRSDDKRSGNDKKSKKTKSAAGNSSKSDAVSSPEDAPLDRAKVSSEFLDAPRGKRGKYNLMDAARVVEHKTMLMSSLPAGWKFIDYKTVDEYNKISYIQCDRFIVAVYEDEFGVRHEYFCPIAPADTARPHENTLPGTHCTPELITDIILDTYKHLLPNHRCNDKMQYDGFQVCENTRKNWLRKCAQLLLPIQSQLRKELFKVKTLLNIDETWHRVRIKLKGDGKKLGKYKKKYIWAIINKKTKSTCFLYDNDEEDSRGSRPIEKFLADYSGAIQSDGYVVYKHLAKSHPNMIHLQCWAHVRARFKRALDCAKDKFAGWFVTQIGRLYLIEAECLMKGLSSEETRKRRNMPDVTAILESVKSKAEDLLSRSRTHYGSTMHKALNYMLNGWDDLLRYRDHGDYSIDNSAAERAIRPITVSRNGSMFFSSEKGVALAMDFHSLIETGKNRGFNLKNWLTSLIREVMGGNKDYEGLLQGAYIAL